MGPQPLIGPAASGRQAPAVAAQPQAGAPLEAGLVGTTHPHPGRPGSARSRFALRNWRVRWRLAALIAVPLVTAVVLGALTIYGDVSNWQTTAVSSTSPSSTARWSGTSRRWKMNATIQWPPQRIGAVFLPS